MARPPSGAASASLRLKVLAAVLAAGAVACLALNLPGQFSPDSIWQLQQGRTGVYNTWHPPVMAWMLGLFDRISPGAPGFIVFDALLAFGALFAFGSLSTRPRWGAVVLAAVLSASPLLLIYQGDVWKDVLFADAALAGFAALAWAARSWASARLRPGLLITAFALFALASLVRQNGLVVLAWGAVGLAAIAWRRERRPRRAVAYGLAALVASLAVVAAASWALATRGDGEPAQAQQVELLQAWDLSGAARADPRLRLDVLRRDAPRAERFIRAARTSWTPERLDGLLGLPGESAALDDASGAVARQWKALIAGRPDLYVRVRLADFADLVATPHLMACRPLFVGLDGPPATLKALGLAPRHRAQDAWARRYSLGFVGTPALSHLLYAGLAVVLLVLAIRDLPAPDTGDRIAIIALLAAALTFAASFLVIGVACDYRYLYLLDLAAMAALLHRAAIGFAVRSIDRGRGSSAPTASPAPGASPR